MDDGSIIMIIIGIAFFAIVIGAFIYAGKLDDTEGD